MRLETTRTANDGAPTAAQRRTHQTPLEASEGRPYQTPLEPENVRLTPNGRLVDEEGGTRYVNGSFWTALEQEDTLTEPVAEVAPAPTSVPSVVYDSDSYHKFIFGMSIAPEASGLRHLHPLETRIFTLWQIYIENVDPLLKIVHVPTTQGQLLRACSHLDAIPPPVEAVMFSIYYAAVTSLQSSTRIFPDENRADLLDRYRTGLEQALAKAKFVSLLSSSSRCSWSPPRV